MFNRKIKELELSLRNITECKVCGCLIKKSEELAIIDHDEYFRYKCYRDLLYSYTMADNDMSYKSYYCRTHKPPYDRVEDGKYYKDNVEVDNKGRLIK
jgi:hypothetical protein